MAFVPPGAQSPKELVAILNIERNSQNASHVGNGNFSFEDAGKMSKVNGYIPISFTESELQIKAYLPVLFFLLGKCHNVIVAYGKAMKYLEDIKIAFQEALIGEVGE